MGSQEGISFYRLKRSQDNNDNKIRKDVEGHRKNRRGMRERK